jgi:hypothetical protein
MNTASVKFESDVERERIEALTSETDLASAVFKPIETAVTAFRDRRLTRLELRRVSILLKRAALQGRPCHSRVASRPRARRDRPAAVKSANAPPAGDADGSDPDEPPAHLPYPQRAVA